MLSVQEQVYGASLIWSEAKYNFAFWNVRQDIDWDAEYRALLDKVAQPMELLDYYLELSRFISLLNDGHTGIIFPETINKDYKALPVKIRNLSGKHIVVNVADGCPIPVFSEICAINGMDFDGYIKEKILPYCWNIKLSSVYETLYSFIPVIEKYKDIEFDTSNGKFTVSPCSGNIDWSLPQKLNCGERLTQTFTSDGLIISHSDDNIAVLTLPTFMDDEMPRNFYKHLDELKDCRGFVIDVRDNGGGNSNFADAFSQAFIHGEFQTGKVKHPVHNGAYKAWGTSGKPLSEYDLSDPWSKKVFDYCTNNVFEEEIATAHYPDCPLTLDQPVVILENAATGSSSENLLINFDTIGRATIVGVPSYGSTGNPLLVDLPGGGRARICTRRYTYPNDKEFINIGIEPHIHADLSPDDLMSGRDSVLDKGLEVIREAAL